MAGGASKAVNLATFISLAAFVVGALFAVVTWSIASAPSTRGLRVFSLSCLWGALYGASNATLASSSYALSRWGVRLGLLFVGAHTASWFVYTARRDGRRLSAGDRIFVGGSVAWGLLSLVPDLLYHSDEAWIHDVPALGIRYVDARSTVLGDVAFAFFGCGMAVLLWRSLRRLRTAGRMDRAEAIGLGALAISGLNDALITADLIRGPYLLDLGYLVLVVAVGSSLARRFVDDANQLVAAQAELVQRERLAAIGEMSAVVAHEVRNPVAVILNAAASMRRRPDDREALLRIVEEEAERLTQMVSDLLAFARPSTLRLVEEPIGAIIESALDAVRKADVGHALDVVVTVPADTPPLVCDVRLIRQAIMNLVSNAVQAPARKSPVQVRVESMPRTNQLRLTVSDDGAGVASDIRDRVFRPFFTTRATGTGLGLAVVQRIVQAHGGQLSYRDTPGGGATFEVVLPRSQAR
ncbi:MAG TPA: ATP-binding protein [Labilithrix sp.]|nr:ATP-binding protein [Labilithrix sp.]